MSFNYDSATNYNLYIFAKKSLLYHSGIGLAGDIVKVRRHLARSDLLPSGKAVYASPENIAEYAVLKTVEFYRLFICFVLGAAFETFMFSF